MKKLLFILLLLIPVLTFAQKQIKVKNCEIISGTGSCELLFDGNIKTGWFAGWDISKYPTKCLIDLGSEYYISKIRYYDKEGQPKVSFKSFINQKFELIYNAKADKYNAWQEFDLNNIKCRYLEFSIESIDAETPIGEIEIYGVDKVQPKILLKGDALKIGVNGFHWVPQDIINTFPLYRMYQMSQWTWTPQGIAVSPTREANGDYDAFLLKSKETVFCINTVPNWYVLDQNDYGTRKFNRWATDPCKPESYKDFAEYLWQITARYGKVSYPDSLLKVNQIPRWNNDVINSKKSGLNLLKYIEVENEPDRPWKDADRKYLPEEFAALLSETKDGHEGRDGNVGINNADLGMKIVMGGLSAIDLNYIHNMNEWFKSNRSDKTFAADVINIHWYCNSSNSPWPHNIVNLWEGQGCSPEKDGLEKRLHDFKLFLRSEGLENKEVWLSEFGYDTELPSTKLVQYPELVKGSTPEETQGNYLVRTYLIALKCGIDKIFAYNLIDENSASKGYVFGSSGLYTAEHPDTGENGLEAKKSASNVQWLIKELNGWKYYNDISQDGVTILEFRNGAFSKYFIWLPSIDGSKVKLQIGRVSINVDEMPRAYTFVRYTSYGPKIQYKFKIQ